MDYPIIPLIVREVPGSRHSSRGVSPEDGFTYIITGTDSEWVARTLLDAATPLTWGTAPMWKQSVDVQERKGAYGIWDGAVKYGPVKLPDAGDWTWGFDATVETQHVTHGKEHIHDYAASGTARGNRAHRIL